MNISRDVRDDPFFAGPLNISRFGKKQNTHVFPPRDKSAHVVCLVPFREASRSAKSAPAAARRPSAKIGLGPEKRSAEMDRLWFHAILLNIFVTVPWV